MRDVTRWKTRAVLLVFIIAIHLQISSPVAADIIILEDVGVGNLVCLNTTVSMPSAIVNMSIDAYGTIVSNSTFHLESIIEARFRVAFLFPTHSELIARASDYIQELKIRIDGMEIEYSLVNGSSLNVTDLNHYIPADQLMFAIFNVSFVEKQTHTVNTYARLSPGWDTNSIYIRYYVGSSSTWAGDTHEIVNMEVRGYSQFIDHSFFPENHFNSTYDGANVRGIWDFNASEFGNDWTIFQATLRARTNFPPPLLLYVVSGVILVMVAIGVFHSRKNR